MVHNTVGNDQICDVKHENFEWAKLNLLQQLPQMQHPFRKLVDNENTVGLNCLVADRQKHWS